METPRVICNEVIVLDALITNLGETIITNLEIEIVVNDLIIEVISSDVNIAAQSQESVVINIDENFQEIKGVKIPFSDKQVALSNIGLINH